MSPIISYLFVIGILIIIWIPAWITWVPKLTWSLSIKRVVVIIMVALSTTFAIVAIIKPNPSTITKIIGNIVAVVYLLIVFVATYHTWLKLR